MYPLIKVEANALLWNDKQEFQFQLPDSLVTTLAKMGMDATLEPMTIHDQFTFQASVTVAQPLTPLLSLKELYKLKISEIKARKENLNINKREKLKKVEEAYINVLKTYSYLSLIEEAEAMLLKQKSRVEKLIEAKYATSADLSRVESEIAKLQAKKIKVLAGISLSKQYLEFLLGMKPDSNLELNQPKMDLNIPDVQTCYKKALKNRPEFKMIAEREKQLEYAKNASDWTKLPQIAVFGQYKRSEGFSDIMMPKNVGILGVSLKWEFNWKNKWREIDKLTLKQRNLELQKEKARRGIQLEIHKNRLSVKSSKALIQADLAIVKSFKKTYEKTVKLYNNQMATNTDVLAARTNLTKAKIQLLEEKFNYFLNKLKYLKSCGIK